MCLEDQPAGREIVAWFAVHTRSRHEAKVAGLLHEKAVPVYLPVRQVRQRWSDRTKLIELPLFPGYIFARFSPVYRLEVITVGGVVQIVGTRRGPSSIPDDQIEAVRTMVNTRFRCDPYPFLVTGTPVRVKRGPMQGLEGILLRKDRLHRFVVCLPILGQSVGVEIDANCLEAI